MNPDRAGIGVLWALAATLLASGCGARSSASVTVQSEARATVSGAISGLTRAGLVLANGPYVMRVAANTTSFTLPAPVPHTNGYAVAVAAQPSGLICSVSNGSGSMPAGVTTIKVKCLDSAGTAGKAAGDLKAEKLMLFLTVVRSARFTGL